MVAAALRLKDNEVLMLLALGAPCIMCLNGTLANHLDTK